MSEPSLDELRQQSSALEARLTAFRATMKPAPPTAPPQAIGPLLWSRQWFAELFWLAFVLAGSAIMGVVWFAFPIEPFYKRKPPKNTQPPADRPHGR